MKKEKIIELIKLAALKHKQGKYPETLKLLHPVFGKVKIEKIDKLYHSAKSKTIGNLKDLFAKGNYTEIKAIIDSYLTNIDDKEINNLETLASRNLKNPTIINTNKNTTPTILKTTNQQTNKETSTKANQTVVTKESIETNKNTPEFCVEDFEEDTKENDFLLDSSDFNSDSSVITKENINEEKNKDISMLEHTPAEMLGETDIFFSENAFLGDEEKQVEEDADSFDLELESGFVRQATESDNTNSSENDNNSEENDVNYLIKQGVSLYEIGDFENALKSWEKALNLDPSNPILDDYIKNCKNELGIETIQKTPATPKAANNNQEPEKKKHFSKEELNRIISIARTGEIDRAKQLLSSLEKNNLNENEINEASFYIKNLEEEFYVNKTLAKAEELIENHQSEKTIKILKSLLDKFPENEKADELLKLAQKRLEFDLIHSTEKTIELQLEEQPRVRPTSVRPPRPQSSTRKQIKKKQISPKLILIASSIIVICLLGVVGFNYFSSKQKAKKIFNSLMAKIVTSHKNKSSEIPKINKNKEKRIKENFQKILKDARLMYNNGNYLFSYYLYIQAESYGKISENDFSYFQAAKDRISTKINIRQILKKADRKFKKKKYEEAIDYYYQLLSTNPDNIKFKKKLLTCYVQAGIKYAIKGDCQTPKVFFDYALILEPSDSFIPKHLLTIERCINGIISKNQVKNWFTFFR